MKAAEAAEAAVVMCRFSGCSFLGEESLHFKVHGRLNLTDDQCELRREGKRKEEDLKKGK